MTGFEQAMIEASRGLGEGLVGGGIASGFGVSAASGLVVTVEPGISVGPTGYLGVVNTQSQVQVPASAFGATPSRSLIVVRAAPTDSNPINSPTQPFAQVPLNQTQLSAVTLVQGAASATPDYPAKGADDVIVCGLILPAGATSLDPSMLDFEVRETLGTNSELQKLQGHLDDRLRPYRLSPKLVGIKSSQTSGSSPLLFSYPSKSTPSVFPLSGGAHNDNDTLIDFSTGAISGGDTTSAAFTPTVPSGNQSVVATVGLTSSETLSIAYGTPGTYAECLAAVKQQLTSGAGALPNTGGLYTACYVIVTSLAGAYSDCQVIDARPLGGGGSGGGAAPIFFDSVLATGDGATTTFALPKKPKDAASVLMRLDGEVQEVTAFSVDTSAPSVTFVVAPAAGQSVAAFGVADGPSSISGHQEQPSGAVNGSNTAFGLSVTPVDQSSSFLILDGLVVDPTQWALIQSSGQSFIRFNTPPSPGQAVGFFCLINVIAAGTPPPVTASGAYVPVGSRVSPRVIDPAVGLTPTADPLQHWYVAGQAGGGAQVVSAFPSIAPGNAVGQVVKVTVVDPSDFPVFAATGGTSQDGDWPNMSSPDLDGAAITYSYDGVQWSEDSRR